MRAGPRGEPAETSTHCVTGRSHVAERLLLRAWAPMRSTWLWTILAISATTACLDEGKPDEEETDVLDDTKADTHLRPTDHGPIAFAAPAHTALTDDERFHAWTFELSTTAQVELTTSYSLLGQRRTDTVLYLYRYREATSSWGPYIARNDDYSTTTYSQLRRELGAGRYRVLVKGHLAATRGKFKVTVGCDGEGCAPVDPDACLFGSTYGEIAGNPSLETLAKTKIYPATLDQLAPEDQHLLMLAVQQSSHTDVTTPAEALDRVDQDEVNVIYLRDPAAMRAFLAFEYGAGDNSYGAIFNRGDRTMVTNIHDGDLENCTVRRETCLLPADWLALRSAPAFTQTSARVITQASELTGVLGAQALSAFEDSYGAEVTTAAQGLGLVDDNQLNLVTFTHGATGTPLEVIEYGAGDTSVGAIFYAGTTRRAGSINDLTIEHCSLFQ